MNSWYLIGLLSIVILALVLALAWFVWQNMKLRQEQPPGNDNALDEKKFHELEMQLKKNEEVFNKLNPVVESFLSLRNGMADMEQMQSPAEKIAHLHKLMEEARLWNNKLPDEVGMAQLDSFFKEIERATTIIQLLQLKVQSFYRDLRIYDLDEDAERKVRSDFLELSMMAMDAVDSVFNPNYSENRQGINVMLLKDEITIEAARSKAALVTYLDIETPKWAQRFHRSIEKWAGSKEQPLIERTRSYLLNGYRFVFSN